MGLKIETYKDVVLKDLLNDYRCTFHKHTCKLKTNYKKLPEFEIFFHEDGVPHLLGLHYVSTIKYASGIIKDIDSGKMTSKSIQKQPNFGEKDLRNRILLYPFLHDVFVDQKLKICVPVENMKPNPLRLSCVFTELRGKEEVILGLRKDKTDGMFKPTTLHSNKHLKYTKMKPSKIEEIEWVS